jgi:hypothetical protein
MALCVPLNLSPSPPLHTYKCMNINTPSACQHPASSTFRTPSRGRRVGAPRDLAGDAFETRVRAFLNGRFFELLSSTLDLITAPHSPQNPSHNPLDPPPPTRSLRSRALEVRNLVRLGELSRAVTRADAAQLANHSASTISSLAHLHPDAPAHPSDTPAPRTDILPPPLKPPATPLYDPLIISTMLKKLPLSSAADHGRWRYEHLKWAFSLDSGRSRPSDAQDSLDVASSFVAGRGARAMIALVRFAFNGGIPPPCRSWFLGGRLIALRKEGDTPSLRRLRPIAIGSVLGRVVSKCAAVGSAVRFSTLFQPPTSESCSSRPRTQTDGSPWPVQVGVCCRNGTEIAHHTISALLDTHPEFINVSLDMANAFNALSRSAFLPI